MASCFEPFSAEVTHAFGPKSREYTYCTLSRRKARPTGPFQTTDAKIDAFVNRELRFLLYEMCVLIARAHIDVGLGYPNQGRVRRCVLCVSQHGFFLRESAIAKTNSGAENKCWQSTFGTT